MFTADYVICDKCNRSISKSNFDKHACVDVNSYDSISKIQSIRDMYDKGLSYREIRALQFNKWLVAFALKNRKRSISEANKLAQKKYPRKLSEETKDKIRQGRIAYIKRNTGETAFQRRQNRKMSYGEQKLHDLFVKNSIYEKYDVVNEYCEYPYFLDFAFVNEKVDVEFDGKWHFTDKKQTRDKLRNEYLQQKGWRIFRIAYFDLDTFDIKSLLSFIGNTKEKQFASSLIKYHELIQQQKTKRCKQKLVKKQRVIDERQQAIDDRRKILMTIDTSKFGWVGEASKLLNISHTSLRRFIERYCQDLVFFRRQPGTQCKDLDLYKQKIFKRQQLIEDRRKMLKTIDTKQLKWLSEASKLLNLSHQSIKQFVKQHCKDLDVYGIMFQC